MRALMPLILAWGLVIPLVGSGASFPSAGIQPAFRRPIQSLGHGSYAIETAPELLQSLGNRLIHVKQLPPAGTNQIQPPRTDLEVLRYFVLLDGGAPQSIELLSHTTQVQAIDPEATRAMVPPQLGPAPQGDPKEPLVFARFDGPADLYPPQVLSIRKVGTFRGLQVAALEYAPAQISASTGQIFYHQRIEFAIRTAGTVVRPTIHVSPAIQRTLAYFGMDPALESVAEVSWHDRDHLLLITPDAFANQLAPLIAWKRQKGLEVTVTPLSVTGPTSVDIQAYIRNAYNGWDRPPTFVLLAGDTLCIPPFTGLHDPYATTSGYPTDLYYGTLGGPDDVIPEVFIGRLPARNSTDLAAMIAKIVEAELPDTTDLSWLSRGSFIATDDAMFHDLVENTHRYAIAKYFEPAGLAADTIWAFSGGQTADLVSSLNGGTRILCYSGHGDSTIWGDNPANPVYFSGSHIDALDNAGQPAVILSFGCEAGVYGTGNLSLGEAFVLADNRGAVNFWGASHPTIWFEDDYLERRFWDAAFSGQLVSFGEMSFAALLEVWHRGYPTSDYYFEIYNLLGDPTLEFRLGPLGTLQVVYPDTLPSDAATLALQITGIPEAVSAGWATVFRGDSLLAQGSVYGGTALLRFEGGLSGIDTAIVTVVAPGFRTFRGKLQVQDRMSIMLYPDTLLIGQPNTLSITLSSLTGYSVAGLTVELAGLGLPNSLTANTDSAGQATLIVTPPYGETLRLQVTGPQGTPLLERGITVTGGQDFTDPTLDAGAPLLGAIGFLVPGFPGVLTWAPTPGGARLYLTGAGIDTSTTDSTLTLTPRFEGTLQATLAKDGFNTVTFNLPVHPARGTLAGIVIDANSIEPLPGETVSVVALNDPLRPAVTAATDSSGAYQLAEELPVGWVVRQVLRWGYHDYQDTVLIRYGVNSDTLRLIPLVRAGRSGRVVQFDSGLGLDGALVWVRGQGLRDTTDNTGAFELVGIVPGTLVITVLKTGMIALHDTLVVGEGSIDVALDYALSPGPTERRFTFELDGEGFTLSGDWAWGHPGVGLQHRGPANAYDGERVMGTVLDGDFSPSSNSSLETPPLDLDGFSHATLTFYHYYQMGLAINTGIDGGNVKLSADNGQTWEVIHPVGGYPVAALSDLNHVLVGEPGFSGPQGTWQRVQFNLDDYLIGSVEIRLRFHFASTATMEDAGWYIDNMTLTDDVPSAVAVAGLALPQVLTLRQNYPNPFNPSTTIRFDLPAATEVAVVIYDLLGREVARLVDERLEAGFHQIRWAGRDAVGRAVAAGIYIARLSTPEQTTSVKLVLLK